MKILVFIWSVFLIFSFTASSIDTNSISETYNLLNSTNLAKPGCDSWCGNIIVPYPFGIGLNSNCSIGKGFDIYYNTSLNPPRASFIKTDFFSIKQISDSTLQTTNVVGWKCYIENGTLSDSFRITLDLRGWPYTLSQVIKFMVIDCNAYAWLTSATMSRSVSTGCMLFCSNMKEVVGAECSGSGGCQSSIILWKWYLLNKHFEIQNDHFSMKYLLG